MVYVALLLLIIAIILLIYSIALLMGKDGSLFSLFTHEEKSLKRTKASDLHCDNYIVSN